MAFSAAKSRDVHSSHLVAAAAESIPAVFVGRGQPAGVRQDGGSLE